VSGQRPPGQDPVEPAQSLVVEVGATADVVLTDLVSGGYQWVLGPVPDGISLAAEDVEGARRSFRLRGELPGAYDVRLDLVRPWEQPGVPPAESRVVRVDVVRPGEL
jgi:hypothetical protein